ncbi:MAG: MBL fold metallo-hydrolase [Oscillospiraceae bacterium]|nr:MBL fold metallo-hydrolase [Oscillospiraceae bacterium]
MKLTQVKGRTWVAEGLELIPFYRLDDGRCILLDTGFYVEGEELEQSLLDAGLTPAAILGSHAHPDHAGNHARFQKAYRLPVALTAAEAGLCNHILNLKCYTSVGTPAGVRREMGPIPMDTDIVLPNADCTATLLGVDFRCVYTPGHSPGHICIITPDNVCYVGDTLLSGQLLHAKLPYCLDLATDLASKERLRTLTCDAYIAAHRGIFTDINRVVEQNRALMLQRASQIRSAVTGPMTFSQIHAAACKVLDVHPKTPRRAMGLETSMRFFVDYLVDRGDLEPCVMDQILYYTPKKA